MSVAEQNANFNRTVKEATGYTADELQAAFNLVKNPNDWRGSISAMITPDKEDVVAAAVKFYTATEAIFVEISTGLLWMSSVGYRAGPAGDH